MSEAFKKFLKQYNATGRERGDGFCSDHFIGMNENEKTTANEMLAKIANKGDSTAIEGLGLLATQESINELLQLLKDTNQSSSIHLSAASSLWKATNDLRFQDKLISFLSSPEPRIRMRAADELRFTPSSEELLESYSNLLAHESDKKTRQAAALGIMQCIGLLNGPTDIGASYIDIFRDLADTNSKVRAQAMSKARKIAESIQRTPRSQLD